MITRKEGAIVSDEDMQELRVFEHNKKQYETQIAELKTSIAASEQQRRDVQASYEVKIAKLEDKMKYLKKRTINYEGLAKT